MSDSGTKVFNTNRTVSGKGEGRTINRFGKVFPFEYNLDYFAFVNITTPSVPDSIVPFLKGDNTRTIYAIGDNIDKLCAYSMASFPNLTTIYLFYNGVVDLDDDFLANNSSMTKIYVHSNDLATYQSTYAGKSFASYFDTIIEDYEVTIGYTGESTTITLAELQRQIGLLSSAEKAAATKVKFDIRYTEESVKSVAWGFNFTNVFTSLNNNVYYGTTKLDFSNLVIEGSGTLTAEMVTARINGVSSDKLAGVEKLTVQSTFTSSSGNLIKALNNANISNEIKANCYYKNTKSHLTNNVIDRFELDTSLFAIVDYVISNSPFQISLDGECGKIDYEIIYTKTATGWYGFASSIQNIIGMSSGWNYSYITIYPIHDVNYHSPSGMEGYGYTGGIARYAFHCESGNITLHTENMETHISKTHINSTSSYNENSYPVYNFKTADNSNFKSRKYQLSVNGNAKLYLVPVQIIADSSYGLYDLVNGVLYTNNTMTGGND